jgi:hypothetical protein
VCGVTRGGGHSVVQRRNADKIIAFFGRKTFRASGKVFVPQKHILLLCNLYLFPAILPSVLLLFANGYRARRALIAIYRPVIS